MGWRPVPDLTGVRRQFPRDLQEFAGTGVQPGSAVLHLLCLLRGKALHQTEHIRERWVFNGCIGFRSTAGLGRRFNVRFHRDSFVRLAAILFDWRYIEPRLVRRRGFPGRLVHSARGVFQ